MSAVAIPKPSGFRPPFGGGPPIKTTFDGSSSGDPDDDLKRLTENVNRLLATVDQTANDRLDVLLRLLEQRRHWVENDLTVERLISGSPLPPFASLSIEFLLEPTSKEESVYVRLLNLLEDAIFRVRTKISALNGDVATSES